MSSRWLRNSFIYLLILVAVVAIVFSFFRKGDSAKSVPISEVIAWGRDGQLQEITVNGQKIEAKKGSDDPQKYTSRIGKNTEIE
ncbi:MAG: ATP-dependent metallopeptidase FtsH/Yme1/Tma family protein, partial [Chloroflexi bacterium]|nr:ATP-dependent metallopeptidase FtsH/Yme1/Tma family protein [Chloroflexota bacterium]